MPVVVETMAIDNQVHPQRPDRMLEKPSSKNAQGMFSPEACLFVGNIPARFSKDDQENDLQTLFSQFGTCYAKVKIDRNKQLPGAFVQFEKVEDANKALAADSLTLHGRNLRIERAKGQRTGRLYIRAGGDITVAEAEAALKDHGTLAGVKLEHHPDSVATCIVTFAFVEDYRDAIKHFQGPHNTYQLQKTNIEGNPFTEGGKFEPTSSSNSSNRASASPPRRGYGRGGRYNGSNFHRNGPPRFPSHDGGYPRHNGYNSNRGFSNRGRGGGYYRNQHYNNQMPYHGQYPEPHYDQYQEQYHEQYQPSNAPQQSMQTPFKFTAAALPFIPSCGYPGPQPEMGYNYPPQGNEYNNGHNNDYNNGYNNGNGGPFNAYDNSNMGPGNYDPGFNPGAFIPNNQPAFNNMPPMYPGSYQHSPNGPPNGMVYYPGDQYMPFMNGPMNGQFPPPFGFPQQYQQGQGYPIPPNPPMPFAPEPPRPQDNSNSQDGNTPATAAQSQGPLVINGDTTGEKPNTATSTDGASNTESVIKPQPAAESEQGTAEATSDETQSTGESTSHTTENESDGLLKDKKEVQEEDQDQDQKEEGQEQGQEDDKEGEDEDQVKTPVNSSDVTVSPLQVQNGNRAPDSEEETLNQVVDTATEIETITPPVSGSVSRERPPATNGNSSSKFLKCCRDTALEKHLDVSPELIDEVAREIAEEVAQKLNSTETQSQKDDDSRSPTPIDRGYASS